jgi:hypothetical protein
MCTSRLHRVYFPSWTSVLHIIIGYTSRCHCVYFLHFLLMFPLFLCNLWETLHFSNWTFLLPFVLPTLLIFCTSLYIILSFSNTICGLVYFPKLNTCTSKTNTLHFSLSLHVLPSFCRWFLYFCFCFWHTQTSESKYLYFPMSINVLLVVVHLYFPLVDFVIFLACHVEPILLETEYLSSPHHVCTSHCYCRHFIDFLDDVIII